MTRTRLGERIQAAGSRTGTPCSSSFGIALRRNRRTVSGSSRSSAGSAASNSIPISAEHRIELGELADQIAAWVAVAEEGEDVVVTAPQQCRGKPERRVVLGL